MCLGFHDLLLRSVELPDPNPKPLNRQSEAPTVEAQKLETSQPRSLRVMYKESQHYLALIRFPTLWGLL